MKTVKISLNSIDKVKSFVNDVTKFDTDFDLVSGRYVIDAKSIMGIFSLDLSKPIDLNIHSEEDVEKISNVIKPLGRIPKLYPLFYTLHVKNFRFSCILRRHCTPRHSSFKQKTFYFIIITSAVPIASSKR